MTNTDNTPFKLGEKQTHELQSRGRGIRLVSYDSRDQNHHQWIEILWDAQYC